MAGPVIEQLINETIRLFVGIICMFFMAGPVIEQLINESIGRGFIGSSFLGIIAHKNGQPQGLHQDQGVMHMGGVQQAPWSVNTMCVGCGSIQPMSIHRWVASAGSGPGASTH